MTCRSPAGCSSLLAALALAACAPPPAIEGGEVLPPPGATFVIGWGGDTLLADGAQGLLDTEGYDAPFAELTALPRGDVFFLNLEGPITTRSEQYNAGQTWHYNAQPEAAAALQRFGVAVGGLANNHIFDRGPEGLTDTLDALNAVGIESVGAGQDEDGAMAPVLVDTGHGIAAILAFGSSFSTVPEAGPSTPGALRTATATMREARERALEAGADFVIASVHWGTNYSDVSAAQRETAGRFATLGYDLVVGHHSHMQQPMEFVGDMPVLFSLGNFVFGTPGRFDDATPGYGLLARTFFGPDGLEGIALRCLRTDNQVVNYVPRECTPEEAATVLPALHPELLIGDTEALLTL